MSQVNQLDAHERPPDRMRILFKKYQKSKETDVLIDADIIDMSRASNGFSEKLRCVPQSCFGDRGSAFREFLSSRSDGCDDEITAFIPAFEVTSISGLYIFPNLLTPEIQLALLHRLLHRDLSNPKHCTNVQLHHDIAYPSASCPKSASSFFCQNKSLVFLPKDPAVHKAITIAQFLDKKLRWMTLGGQYDWTAKQYPPETPPPFPADIKQLLERLFPATNAEAAIVNIYSPGDTLSIHRDVSEYCHRGLVSVSIGCDGLFIIGNQVGTEIATIRLRSGDALYMTGSSRYAWHGVPRIIPDTCPSWLAEWPASGDDTEYNNWRDWMYNKRINLNVRQMVDIQSSI